MDTQPPETLPQDEAVRLCFRFKPQNIPGEPGARSITVADAFIQLKFQRKFDWDKDYVYTPAAIDEVGITRYIYMFLDVNKHVHSTFQTLHCYKIEGCSMYDILSAAYMRANIYAGRSRGLNLLGHANFQTIFHGAGGRSKRKLYTRHVMKHKVHIKSIK